MNFTWLSFRDHWLLRPDSIIGDPQRITWDTYITKKVENEKNKIIKMKITKEEICLAKGLLVIIDEILSNATDRQQHDLRAIRIHFDREYGDITIKDDGGGMEVSKYQDTDKWIPTIAFTEEKSGTNFDDSEKRHGVGRNGYGAKATNVFSKKISLETLDVSNHLLFKQNWVDNLSSGTIPKITKCAKKKGYTEVRFLPDYERFGMSAGNPDDMKVIESMLYSRAWDIVSTTNAKISVYYNDEKLPARNLIDYSKMFSSHEEVISWAMDSSSTAESSEVLPSWGMKIAVSLATKGNLDSSGVEAGVHALVNSLRCPRGTHIEWMYRTLKNAINSRLLTQQMEKAGAALTIGDLKSMFFIIFILDIPNPSYTSATKEELRLNSKEFLVEWKPTNSFVKQLEKMGVKSFMEEKVKRKDIGALKSLASQKSSSKSRRRGTLWEKYDPATGKGKSPKILILTEGDSAKTLAVAGISVVGRENYGIFPLRGKLLNPNGKTSKQIADNVEIKTIIQILGLNPGNTNQTTKDLNYQKVLLFSDADVDGAHICALVVNMIHFLFPHILQKNPTFLQRFASPIIKLWDNQGIEKYFFSMAEKNAWLAEQVPSRKIWKERYYKGLGTSTNREAKMYFSRLKDHVIDLEYTGQESDEILKIMFDKNQSDARKSILLNEYDPGSSVDYSQSSISFKKYVLQELLHFSWEDNLRSIPHVVDGMKPSERKILYTCLMKNMTTDVKVSELSGIVSAFSKYHHGEQSLQSTIINMAQNHVGSNNINLIVPQGQHGSRLNKSSEHASPRYLFTRMSSITKKIFHEDDMPLYKYIEEEGKKIEPTFFVPVIPMLLVNGANGIGTGWSTSIPSYNPFDIIKILKEYISSFSASVAAPDLGEDSLIPWVEGFKGRIERIANKFVAYGIWETTDSTSTIQITELPPGTWTHPYITKIQALASSSGKGPPLVCDIINNSSENHVDIEIICNSEPLAQVKDFPKQFHLVSDIQIGNMHALTSREEKDERLIPKKYEDPIEIIEKFIPVRLDFYRKRKENIIQNLSNESIILKNRVRFVQEVIGGIIPVIKMTKIFLIQLLEEKKYDFENDSFNYLLNMHIVSFTEDLAHQLEQKYVLILEQIEKIRTKPEKEFWFEDLVNLEIALKEFYAEREEDRDYVVENQEPKNTKKRPTKKRKLK